MYISLFQGKQGALGIQQVQVARNPIAITQVCQIQAAAFGRRLCCLGRLLLGERGAAVERILHFLEAGLDGFFILRHRNGSAGLAGF